MKCSVTCGLAMAVCSQIFVDAAAAALIFRFQLDRHSGAVIQIDPFDAMLLDVLGPCSPGGMSTPSPPPLRISGWFFFVSIWIS